MSNVCLRLALLVGLVTLGGCQSVGTGHNMPSGPAIISPNGTASATPMFTGDLVAVSQSTAAPSDATPPTAPPISSPPRILRPASAKPIPPAEHNRSPFRLTSQQTNWADAVAKRAVDSPPDEAPILRFETLETTPPLGTVVSPRNARQSASSNVAPSPQSTIAPAKPSPTTSLVKPLVPKSGEETRVQRLPSVTKPTQGFLTRPTLPQKPIPIYPEISE